MQRFRSHLLFLFCFFLLITPVFGQEEIRTWVLTGFPKAQFKGRVVAKLVIRDKTEAFLFETKSETYVLDEHSFDSKTQDELAAMELPIAESQVVYETGWKQLGGDNLFPSYKHMVDGAEEAFDFLLSEKEDSSVAYLGKRLLDLSEGDDGININTDIIQTYAAKAFASIGDIANAKAIVSKIPEERVPLSMWESMFDFEKVADLSMAEMERGHERFRKTGGRFPISDFENAIRRNIRIGRVERVTGIADLWLSEYIKERRVDPSGIPPTSPEERAKIEANRRRNNASSLPAKAALWWVCQSGTLSEVERSTRWKSIKGEFANEEYSNDYYDFQLAKELVELGLSEESEDFFIRLALPGSEIEESLRTEAEFELGRIAEARGDREEANRRYLECIQSSEVEPLIFTFCIHRRLMLSLQSESDEESARIASKELLRRISKKPLNGSTRGRHPFVMAALLRKMNPDWEFSKRITDEAVGRHLLHKGKTFPPKGEEVESSINSSILMALTLAEYGEVEEARRLAKWSFQVMGNLLQPQLIHLDESVRMEASREISQLYRLLWKVGMEDELRYLLYQFKGGVLDGVLNDIEVASQWPSGKELLDQLRSEQLKLIDLELSNKEDRDWQIQMTEKKISLLSRKLNLGVAELKGGGQVNRARGSYKQLARQLPENTVLVDYILAPSPDNLENLGAVYLAVVTGKSIGSTIVEIGEPEAVERHIRLLQQSGTRLIPDNEVRVALRELNNFLLEPVLKLAPAADRLIISPDSLINNVPFVALLDGEDQFVGQRLDIRMQRTLRSLSRKRVYTGKEIAIYCRPDYQAKVTTNRAATTRAISKDTRDGFRNFDLADLPGTETEGLKVQSILSEQGWDVTLQKGNEASETGLMKIGSPRILHLATHGFYLPPAVESGTPTQSFLPVSENEMLRVGLFLAGGQRTLDAWNQPGGKAPPSLEDGIVFAAELSQMRFPGTELVVLSACETGLGDVESGEGVMGFSRALETAGVANTLMTLWPVDDLATVGFMSGFYQKLSEGIPYGEALQTTQLDELLKFRKSDGIAAAVRLAAPFQIVGSDSSVLQ